MTVLPHPRSGRPFGSPVAPGTGWPGDPSLPDTPRAGDARAVGRLAASAADLTGLDACVAVCEACPRLVAWRTGVAVSKRAAFADQPYWGRPVPSLGDPAPHALVVGLAPAAHGGNRTGRMFTGDRSGDWLFAALHRAGFANQPTSVDAADGLRLTGVRITAPVHCAPPDNKPTAQEKATCAAWLDRELALLADTVESILALGGIGWSQLLASARGSGWGVPRPLPRFGHGAEATLFTPAGRPVRLIGSYHVSQQNTFTGRLTEQMLDDVVARLRRPQEAP